MKYSLSPKEIPRENTERFLEGSHYISPFVPTPVTIQTFLVTISVLSFLGEQLEELILCITMAAGAIFSSILLALLGVYWKIYPHFYWKYIFQYTSSVELDLYGILLHS